MLRNQSKQNSLNLHNVLQEFKKQQHDKANLMKKINVIMRKYQNSTKKNKMVNKKINKLNKAQLSYRQNKQQIQNLLLVERDKQQQKIQELKTKRVNEKDFAGLNRTFMLNDKIKHAREMKSGERINDLRIFQNWKNNVSINRQKSLQIRLKEQQAKSKITRFLQTKRTSVRKDEQKDVRTLEQQILQKRREMTHMKQIENQLSNKFNMSRTTLNESRTCLQNMIRF